MQVMGLTHIMTMVCIVLMEEVVKYFRGITIYALIHKYVSHEITDVINVAYSFCKHKNFWVRLNGAQSIIYHSYQFFVN